MAYDKRDYERLFRLMESYEYTNKIDLTKKVEAEYKVRYTQNQMTHMLTKMSQKGLLIGRRGKGYKRVAPEETDMSVMMKRKKRIYKKKPSVIKPELQRHGAVMMKLSNIEGGMTGMALKMTSIEKRLKGEVPAKEIDEKGPGISWTYYYELLAQAQELKLMKVALRGRYLNPFRKLTDNDNG